MLLGMAAVQEVAPELLGGFARWVGRAHKAATLARPGGQVKACKETIRGPIRERETGLRSNQ
jgi:hypothetical protein